MTESQYAMIDGGLTHYLEAGHAHRGRRKSILLLHSAEFGGAAEVTWEHNIEELAQRYHVLAPDHLGFGRTEKLFDFGNQYERRIRHIRNFIEKMRVGPVHVIGSSMSGGLSLTVAARKMPDWPMASVVCCSGGGDAPNNAARNVLNSYDGTKEHMRRIVETMFVDPKWAADDDYVHRRWELANMPGAWEATAAARFKAPFREPSRNRSERDRIDYANIGVPTLVFAGKLDPLRVPGYADAFVAQIPQGQLHVFECAGHMGNIECAAEFNARTIQFLESIDP